MDDEESNKALLLSHPNPNSNDSKKSLGEKGMYMDWLGQRSTDDRDDLGGCNRALWITGKRKEKKRKESLHESSRVWWDVWAGGLVRLHLGLIRWGSKIDREVR